MPVRPGSAEGTPMQELRLVAVSEDGTYVVLGQLGRATRFTLPNDERLRAVVRGQFSRLAQYEIEVESPLRPKEIQARIRSGETADQIADTAGVPIERVRWFEGPVLAERAYVAQQAQAASVRRPGDSGPGPRLGEIVTERLRDLGADPEEAQWDSRKRGDGSWLVELSSDTGAARLTAAWVFDPRRRHAVPDDDQAARLSLSEDTLQAAGLAAQPTVAARGRGTVTPFVPRSSPAVPRQAAAPHSEAASEAASEPAAAAAAAAVAAAEALAEPTQVARADIQAEAAAQGRRAARLPDPQPSPAGVPPLQPPARGTRRQGVPERAAAQAPEAPVGTAPLTQEHTARPEPEHTAQPKPEHAAQPKPEHTAQPKPEHAAQPKPEHTARPEPEQAAQPKPEHTAQPKPEHAAAQAAEPAAPDAPGASRRRREMPAAGTQRSDAPQQPVASAAGPAAADETAAAAEAPQEQPPRSRPARKAAGGRGRRSSVPTWDEIMFGSSRRQD
jgi:Protein of unknown function (DUF3071)